MTGDIITAARRGILIGEDMAIVTTWISAMYNAPIAVMDSTTTGADTTDGDDHFTGRGSAIIAVTDAHNYLTYPRIFSML